MMKHKALVQKDLEYVWHPFTQMGVYAEKEPIIIESGKGSYLYDTKGRRYLDGYASLWVNVHGHQNQQLNRAIQKQLKSIAHSTLLGSSNIPSIKLAEKLVQITPERLKKVFYSDTQGVQLLKSPLKLHINIGKIKTLKSMRRKTNF